MAKVRLLVGTHKGAFVLTSDERRKQWKVDGPPCNVNLRTVGQT